MNSKYPTGAQKGQLNCNPPVFDSKYELMKSVDVLKAGLVRHREDNEESVSRPHVLLPHRTEFFLTSGVQHCEDGGVHVTTQVTPQF